MNVKYSKGYTTHMTMLIKTVQKCRGDVLEFGAGPFSTPLLHWLCKEHSKKLVTLESNPDFYNYANQFRSAGHKVIQITDWDIFPVDRHWGVVFIDHDFPSVRRGTEAIRFKNSTDFIVLHDSEHEEFYGYDKIWKHFKYRYNWKECRPWTTVVSNFDDLSWLAKK